ncbi:MAG: PAS domain-containing protein, partial [Chitinophagaceae bacterium]|nr:PAS domain-containing protein [Chitinophagaceae bacterium]
VIAGTESSVNGGEEESFKQILTVLRTRKGMDFTYYKQTTIRRRILRRLALINKASVKEYLEFLKQNNPEQDILFQDMLIPVTTFFRDTKSFEYLYQQVFPELLKDKSIGNPLRIWIAGCSTGEEAYSMGICLHEFLSDRTAGTKIQIFASDLSEKAIAKARSGLYHKKDLEGVSDLRLQQFFNKKDGYYQVKKNIRDMCVFACHNFLKDPPFSKIDLVSCRNVLIYMEPFLQKKAFQSFHYALRDKGYLFLGKSETPSNSGGLFAILGKKEKLYIKITVPGRAISMMTDRNEEAFKDTDYSVQSNQRKKDDYQKNADDILLAQYTPVGVIVNEQLDIVQFRGATGDYLEPAPGKASLNVLKMARGGLSFELRNALHKSKSANTPYKKKGIPIHIGKRLVTIEVIPLPNAIDPHFLILFQETTNAPLPAQQATPIVDLQLNTDDKDVRINYLEKELVQAREDMRSISEDQEAVNEELQSANEELLSGGEELQSLNEELETSKEELQSTNEELVTVNQELNDRNEQLNQSRVYAEAITATIHEPLLVLSREFKILSANKSFYKTFGLSEESAIGRMLFELQDRRWDIPDLRNQLQNAQEQTDRFVEWEVTYAFPFAGRRTICFNAQPIQKENGENWTLLAFNDITLWKERALQEKKNAEYVTRILESLPQMTLTSTPNGRITYFNHAFLDYTGLTAEAMTADSWEEMLHPSHREQVLSTWGNALSTGESWSMELKLKRRDDTYRWHEFRAIALRNENGIILTWVGTATDIQNQKSKEQAKDEFIGIASHELKTPLATAKAYLELLETSLDKSEHKDVLFARKAGESINRLNGLINELLDVTKINHGQLDLNRSDFSLTEMIADAIEGVQMNTPQHQIHFTSDGQTQTVFADRERLQQVVINLLTNAIKYSPHGDRVEVHLSLQPAHWTVSVTDHGIGIQQKNLTRVFERYYREEGRAVHFQGLGIGLSISADIIKRHQGKLWATSEEGNGSTFYFTIPQQPHA